MFIAEVVSVSVDEKLMDDKGRLDLGKAKLVAYSHGEYFMLGEKLGKFGYSVAKKPAKGKKSGKTEKKSDKDKGKKTSSKSMKNSKK